MNVQSTFTQATLAFAAYSVGLKTDPVAENAGKFELGAVRKMTTAQFDSFFSSEWWVLAQIEDASGASMTLFRKGEDYYLAVRGTDVNLADLTTDGLLALGQPMAQNAQFIALRETLLKWTQGYSVTDPETGVVSTVAPLVPTGTSFTVTGHSLGGYLATGLKLAQSDSAQPLFNISDAYLFNSPGLGGVWGNVPDLYQAFFGYPASGPEGIWNLQGLNGISLVAGLGIQLTEPLRVFNEYSDPLGNHSIVPLTATLALMAAISDLTGVESVPVLNALINASGLNSGQVPEVALDCLRRVVLSTGAEPPATPLENFDAFYTNLTALVTSTEYQSLKSQGAQLLDLSSCTADQLVALAQADSAQGQAVCQALWVLSPLALVSATTSAHGYHSQPAEFWQARATMLERLDWFGIHELKAYDPTYVLQPGAHQFEAESAAYFDVGTQLSIQKGPLFANLRLTKFGASDADTLKGGGVSDTLFGGAGADSLEGDRGADWLVGGLDDDRLSGGQGADTYVYRPGDGKDWIDTFWAGDGAQDTLRMDNIRFDEVRIGHENYALYLEFGGIRAITVYNWYLLTPDYRLKDIQLSDRTLTTDQLTELGLTAYGTNGNDAVYATPYWSNTVYAYAGHDTVSGSSGQDTVYGGLGNDSIRGGYGHDWLYGNEDADVLAGEQGHDTLVGGTGNDTLRGGADPDTYRYAVGDGCDTIYAYGAGEGAVDLLVLTDLLSSQVTFTHSQQDLLVQSGGATIIVVNGWYSLSADYRLSALQFLDGSLTTDEVTARGLPIQGTANRDTLYATAYWDQALYGYGGNDTLYGSTGNDSLYGGADNDRLSAWSGQDSLDGGSGVDYLFGEAGHDTLIGGIGSDFLSGGPGDDVFIFHSGDAVDLLMDESGFDTLIFTDLTLDQVHLQRTGSSLDILVGTAVQATIVGQYSNATPAIDVFCFGDQSFSAANIDLLAAA